MESIIRYSDLAGTTKVGETDFTYDSVGRTTNIHHQDGSSTTLANTTWTYDLGGRVETETIDGTTKTFTYDQTHQLTDDDINNYSYDDNGNRTMTGYQTGTGNQLTNDGTYTYTFDAEGNLTKKSKGVSAETWTQGYNHHNQMTWIEKRATDGGTLELRVEYEYDALKRRISEEKWTSATGTVVTNFSYDGNNIWADLDNANALTMRYIRPDGIDGLGARVDSGGTAGWYLLDRQGTVIANMSATGTVLNRITYDGFGNILSETGASNGDRFNYTGREFDDDTGYQFNRRRYYDPATGRWTTRDPIGFEPGDYNLYRYIGNSSLNAIDPLGLQPPARPPIKPRPVWVGPQQVTPDGKRIPRPGWWLRDNPIVAHPAERRRIETGYYDSDEYKLWEIAQKQLQFAISDAIAFGIPKSEIDQILKPASGVIFGDYTKATTYTTQLIRARIRKKIGENYRRGLQQLQKVLQSEGYPRDFYEAALKEGYAPSQIINIHNNREMIIDRIKEWGKIQAGKRFIELFRLNMTVEKDEGEDNTRQTFKERVEQAIQEEWAERGDFTADAMTVTNIDGPHKVANIDPALGKDHERYQVTVHNEATDEMIDVSVNFDPTTGTFGTIKPASGK